MSKVLGELSNRAVLAMADLSDGLKDNGRLPEGFVEKFQELASDIADFANRTLQLLEGLPDEGMDSKSDKTPLSKRQRAGCDAVFGQDYCSKVFNAAPIPKDASKGSMATHFFNNNKSRERYRATLDAKQKLLAEGFKSYFVRGIHGKSN